MMEIVASFPLMLGLVTQDTVHLEVVTGKHKEILQFSLLSHLHFTLIWGLIQHESHIL